MHRWRGRGPDFPQGVPAGQPFMPDQRGFIEGAHGRELVEFLRRNRSVLFTVESVIPFHVREIVRRRGVNVGDILAGNRLPVERFLAGAVPNRYLPVMHPPDLPLRSRRWRLLVRCFALGSALCGFSLFAAKPVVVRHEPAQPRPGETVRITVAAGLQAEPAPVLEFQVVPPGNYVAKADPRFERDWTRLPLKPAAGGGFSADVPATAQQHRNLVRYRIRSGNAKTILLPAAEDAQGNYAYFVYAGVPEWKGAVNPTGSGAARTVQTFPAAVLTNVAVYHLLAAKRDVEAAMWRPRWDGDVEDPRHAYRHTGTFVCDGEVYDHVKFRARGGGWRHAMGKNMWKFNFNPGHRLAARDGYGRRYAGKWDKLNLGACIQQGDYGMRGEQGLFEAVTFRMFNLAGTAAPRTHWVHLRVISEAEESPADQYRGDFWGLYLAVEEIEGDFLKEHGLPDGNLYKIEGFEPSTQHVAAGQPTDGRDAREFMAAVMRGGGRPRGPLLDGRDAWWQRTLDLDRYYAYRSVVEAAHHYDIGSGKNYFFYHDLASGRWQTIPWDVDLSWGDRMYGDGEEPFAQILGRSPFREAYQEKLAEFCDLLFNPAAMDRLIGEHAAMIWNGRDRLSLADADRAKWDYHPIMSSRYVMRGKSDPGLFYFGNPDKRLEAMLAYMKGYVKQRQPHLRRLLEGYRPAPAPTVAGPVEVKRGATAVSVTASGSGLSAENCEWRLADVTRPADAGTGRLPWGHEAEALWTARGGVKMEVPGTKLQPGHSYRVRVRQAGAPGTASRWSEPWEFTVR